MTARDWRVFAGIGHPDLKAQLVGSERAYLENHVDAAVAKLKRQGVTVGISRMDAGFGLILARKIVENGMHLWAYRPGPWQAEGWPPALRREWDYLCTRASAIEDVSPFRTEAAHRMCDRALFDAADVGLAWWNGERHGREFQALQYAVGQRQIPVIRLDPTARDEEQALTLPTEAAWRRRLDARELVPA
ncbi:hypothetical protein [Micromonospora sp. NPDC005652]|uniref:hypothetical protein n=1 Tax=Micromonospora sp. NPDC005652 TaxID=3157046 RepID=UPI0033C944C1